MPINECCKLDVVCCETDASIPQVAELMRRHHVGDVVVIENQNGARMPVGIVTDRDIVLEIIAPQLDIDGFTAGDIMNTPLVAVQDDEGFVEALRTMRTHKVRRLPVVTQMGALFGIVTADDIINILAAELSMMTEAIADQPRSEARVRR